MRSHKNGSGQYLLKQSTERRALPLCGVGKLITKTSWGCSWEECFLFPGRCAYKSQQNLLTRAPKPDITLLEAGEPDCP